MVRRTGGFKNIAPRTGAGINQRRVAQFLPRREIDFAPFTLDVGRKCAANVRSFIPSQSKPAKVFDDGVAKFCRAPIVIQIFDSENELSTALLSAFLGAPEGDGMANMKITRRRGRNAAAIRNFRFQISDFRLA
jgi:hypothetical protein